MAILKNTTVNDTAGVKLSSGTSAQRTTGSAVVTSFTTVGSTTWSVPVGVKTVEVLVIAGGGGGGNALAGGGGAGGYVEAKAYSVTPGGTVPVIVGAGGAGGILSPGYLPGTSGSPSQFGNLVAIGGGAGAGYGNTTVGTGDPATAGVFNHHGKWGGSGGGGGGTEGMYSSGGMSIQAAQPSAGGFGFGFAGGTGWGPSPVSYAGGGGGGAGGKGSPNGMIANAPGAQAGGNGGPGRASSITGTSIVRAGGGGGSAYAGSGPGVRGLGGSGGGGNGGTGSPGAPQSNTGSAGTTNTGSGGGGGPWGTPQYGPGYAGGPGIVIVRYVLDDGFVGIPQTGATRWNTTLARQEIFDGQAWNSLGPKTVVSFTATGPSSFSVPSGITEVEVLVVAGGGSSGGIGGGGGGGGIVHHTRYPVTPGVPVPLYVGAGGPSGGTYPGPKGSVGADSTFGTLTAKGGGAGGSWNDNIPIAGGSGAGGTGTPSTGIQGGVAIQNFQTGNGGAAQYGNPGSRGGYNVMGSDYSRYTGDGQYTAGGGGGAGRAGGFRSYIHNSQAANGDTQGTEERFNTMGGRQGGDGKAFDISGTVQYYGGGGGGGAHNPGYNNPASLALGGLGGGGKAASFDWQYGANGEGEPGGTNTGGGGGGGYYTGGGTAKAGAGGPGIIIVRY